jgi:3alpha(or 20beta)-hydroxysteroid dehydrogenase
VFGLPTVLVNNAGILASRRVAEATEAQYRAVLDVNQGGVFLGIRAVIPAMRRAGGGRIVNMGCAGGMVGVPDCFGYVAAKSRQDPPWLRLLRVRTEKGICP